MDRIRLAFKAESLERLERLGPLAASLSTTTGPLDELVKQIRAELHMMKGAAGMLELLAIRDNVAALDATVDSLPRAGPLPAATSQVVLGEFAKLRAMLDRIGSSGSGV